MVEGEKNFKIAAVGRLQEAARDAKLAMGPSLSHARTFYCSHKYRVWHNFIVASECKLSNLESNVTIQLGLEGRTEKQPNQSLMSK